MGAEAGNEGDGDVESGGEEGDAEDGLGSCGAGRAGFGGRGVEMHDSSIPGMGMGCQGGSQQ